MIELANDMQAHKGASLLKTRILCYTILVKGGIYKELHLATFFYSFLNLQNKYTKPGREKQKQQSQFLYHHDDIYLYAMCISSNNE